MNPKHTVYVIGRNCYNELGVKDKEQNYSIKMLVKSGINDHTAKIESIHSGDDYCIYSDRHQNYWSAGKNDKGQCITITNKQCTFIDFFKQNNITIKHVCTSVSGSTTFWITDPANTIYGNGKNNAHLLGLGDNMNVSKPQLIPHLKNVIDVQSSRVFSIALCSQLNVAIIVANWCRTIMIDIPDDIMNVIEIFANWNDVYSTGFSSYGANGHKHQDIRQWTKVKAFEGLRIMKIRTGYSHSLFLTSNGSVWSCGGNNDGQRGLGHTETVDEPVSIKYFSYNQIKIKDIACGWDNNLAIDCNHRLYAWGDNQYGECGDGTMFDKHLPIEIPFFKLNKVLNIKCGAAHCYALCEGEKHYLWGDNSTFQCLVFDGTVVVTTPYQINGVIATQLDNAMIKEVFLGTDNTKIIIVIA